MPRRIRYLLRLVNSQSGLPSPTPASGDTSLPLSGAWSSGHSQTVPGIPWKVRRWVTLCPAHRQPPNLRSQAQGISRLYLQPSSFSLEGCGGWRRDQRPQASAGVSRSWQWGMGAEVLSDPTPTPRPQASGACLVTTVCVCCVPSSPSCPCLSLPPPGCSSDCLWRL